MIVVLVILLPCNTVDIINNHLKKLTQPINVNNNWKCIQAFYVYKHLSKSYVVELQWKYMWRIRDKPLPSDTCARGVRD